MRRSLLRHAILGSTLALLAAACAEVATASAPCVPGRCLDKLDLIPATFSQLETGRDPGSLPVTLADEEPVYQVEISILEQPAGINLELAPELRGVHRARWEVTENFLALADVSPPHDGIPTSSTRRLAYALFSIEAHDVVPDQRRSPAPGGDTLPPSHDPPWYQQRYLRVDWSRDLLDDERRFADTVGVRGVGGAPYYAPSPDDPHAPRFLCGPRPCGESIDRNPALAVMVIDHRAEVELTAPPPGAPASGTVWLRTRIWRE